MTVRDFRPEDMEALREIHAGMGLDYKMPNLGCPLFIIKKVLEIDGHVIGACCLRIECETYLFLHPALDPQAKMQVMAELQPSVLTEAYYQGFDNLVARIPEQTERIFAKRLKQLGWNKDRDGWYTWNRELTEKEAQCGFIPESNSTLQRAEDLAPKVLITMAP